MNQGHFRSFGEGHSFLRFLQGALPKLSCSLSPSFGAPLVPVRRQAYLGSTEIHPLPLQLPPLTQAVLKLFDEGYTLKEIAKLVDEPYWRVCEIRQEAVAYLRERLGD